jgi:hypothetical protein
MNYCLEIAALDCILYDGRRVLGLTASFDEIIFVYYTTLNLSPDSILRNGLPNEARPLRSYVRKIAKFSNDDSAIFYIWRRIRSQGAIDPPTASDVSSTLVTRRRNTLAYQIWRDFSPPKPPDELLSNTTFGHQPLPSPFDWSIIPQDGMSFDLKDGLLVTFEGAQNLAFANVRQQFVPQPGPHRLVIEYSSDGLTTDQGPFFHLYEATSPSRLNLRTEMIRGTNPRQRLTLDFVAPPGAPLLTLQLERTPSQKFDNKIAGALHLYRVSIQPHP